MAVFHGIICDFGEQNGPIPKCLWQLLPWSTSVFRLWYSLRAALFGPTFSRRILQRHLHIESSRHQSPAFSRKRPEFSSWLLPLLMRSATEFGPFAEGCMIILLCPSVTTRACQPFVKLPNFCGDLQLHTADNNTCSASFAR